MVRFLGVCSSSQSRSATKRRNCSTIVSCSAATAVIITAALLRQTRLKSALSVLKHDCAAPYGRLRLPIFAWIDRYGHHRRTRHDPIAQRSEERRVGKEGRSGWSGEKWKEEVRGEEHKKMGREEV